MTEQTTWLQTYGWIIAAAIILAAAATPVIIKHFMTKKQSLPHEPDAITCIRKAIKEENDLIEQHRDALLAAVAISSRDVKLRSIDNRICAHWYASDGIQNAADAMMEAINAALSAGTDAEQIRASVVNPYMLPIRMRISRLRSELDKARSQHRATPGDEDLRAFLCLYPFLETDSVHDILQKASRNQQTIWRALETKEYVVLYEKLLTDMADVFDGEAAHVLDNENTTTQEAHAALAGIAEGIARLRKEYTRP